MVLFFFIRNKFGFDYYFLNWGLEFIYRFLKVILGFLRVISILDFMRNFVGDFF